MDAILFIGRRQQTDAKVKIPQKVAEAFLAPVQWKNFPCGSLLPDLVDKHYCVFNIDTLKPEDKKLESLASISKDRPFWIYSERSDTMIMVDNLNGLMILNPSAGE